jgi:hypothetical protein
MLFSTQNIPSNLTAKTLSVFFWFFWFFFVFFCFFMNKIDNLLTIVWVPIIVRTKPPSRIRCLGQKVLPCRHFEEQQPWTLASNVKCQEVEFLVFCNLSGGNRQPLDLRP